MYKYLVKLRSAILVFLTHTLALPLLRFIRKPIIFPYSEEMLKTFPEGTLGKELVDYLQSKNLQLLPYYVKHDIKHILLEYDTTDKGEVCLQCFMLGNRHASFPVIATIFYGLVTMPEYWKHFIKAFLRGRKCKPIECWEWFSLLPLQTACLKKIISYS